MRLTTIPEIIKQAKKYDDDETYYIFVNYLGCGCCIESVGSFKVSVKIDNPRPGQGHRMYDGVRFYEEAGDKLFPGRAHIPRADYVYEITHDTPLDKIIRGEEPPI